MTDDKIAYYALWLEQAENSERRMSQEAEEVGDEISASYCEGAAKGYEYALRYF